AGQDQVVQTIASTIVGRGQASDFERVRRKPPASLAAYECVLKGNALSWDDPDGAAEAARLFEKAIEIDPGYGFPHALLASIWQAMWWEELIGLDGALRKAFGLAKRVVELAQNERACIGLSG